MAIAETAEAEVASAAAEGGKKKSRSKMILLIVLALLIIGGGVFGFMYMKAKAGHGAAPAEVQGPAVYFALDPAFVVNFQGDDAARYLQIGVTVMARDPAVIQSIKDNDPVVRNALLMLFSGQTFAQLSTTAGKQKLQADALAAIRKIIADRAVKPRLEALYFTSFVMQ